MYHINPETGRPNICRAQTPQSCKFYTAENGAPPHFDSKADARTYYEDQREGDLFATISGDTKNSDNSGNSSLSFSDDPVSLLGYQKNSVPHDCLYVVSDYDLVDSLGVRRAELDGKMVSPLFYDSVQVTGVINHKELDHNSYERFGFQDGYFDRNTVENYYRDDDSNTLNETIMSPECQGSSREKLAVIRNYTDDSKGVNFYLMGKNDSKKFNDSLIHRHIEMVRADGSTYVKKPYDNDHNYAHDTIRSMDTFMEKSKGLQKTVYRGINTSTIKTPVGVRSWDDVEIGQDIRFDAFTSSSKRYSIAENFAAKNTENNHKIIFEIKSASAVNVSNGSTFDYEMEYLIPRGSRFMVVGKHYDEANVSKNQLVTILQLVEINEGGSIVDHHNIKQSQGMRREYNNAHSKVKFL